MTYLIVGGHKTGSNNPGAETYIRKHLNKNNEQSRNKSYTSDKKILVKSGYVRTDTNLVRIATYYTPDTYECQAIHESERRESRGRQAECIVSI